MIFRNLADHEKAELVHSLMQIQSALLKAKKARVPNERASSRAMRLCDLDRRLETVSGLLADVRGAVVS